MKTRNIILVLLTLVFLAFSYQTTDEPDVKGYIIIGKQGWSTINLDVSTFSNGDPIQEAHSQKDWRKATEAGYPAWCHLPQHSSKGKYGKLYNWYAVHDARGLAPKGWHIPTKQEWDTLVNNLGGENVAGNKMKDKSGFMAIASGYRAGWGNFDGEGAYGYFWSYTNKQDSGAYSLYIFFGDSFNYLNTKGSSAAYHIYGDEGAGYSVRCVKD